jgi:hypothetical protein
VEKNDVLIGRGNHHCKEFLRIKSAQKEEEQKDSELRMLINQ